MDMTGVLELIARKMMSEIIMDIAEHQGDCKTQVYARFGNSRTATVRVNELIDEGYVEARSGSGSWNHQSLYMTEKGDAAYRCLDALVREVGE